MSYFQSGIKSLQRGTISIGAGEATHDATMSPTVDSTKTILTLLGWSTTNNTAGPQMQPRLALSVDGTTLTATRGGFADAAVTIAAYQVAEYYR